MMLISVLLFPLVFSFLIILIGKKALFSRFLAIISNLCSLSVSLLYIPHIMIKPMSVILGNWVPPFGINLFFSFYSLGFIIVILLVSLFILITESNNTSGYMYIAHLLLTMAVMGMTATADLFNLFVFLEIAGISSYLLIGSSGNSLSASSTLKYLILSSVSGLMMLLGIAIVYSSTGVLNMAVVSSFSPLKPSLAFVGSFLILLPFAVETKLFPFNSWVAGVYSSSQTRTNALLSSLVGPIGLIVLVKLIFVVMNKNSAFSHAFDKLRLFFVIIGSVSLFIGELAALFEKNIKKLLGFSTIGQLSMVLLGLLTGNSAIMKGAFLIFLSTVSGKLLLFILTIYMHKKTSSSDYKFLRGLGKQNPIFGLLFFIGSFSLMGLPFAASFWGKLELIRGFFYFGTFWFIALFAVLAGTIFEGIYFMKLSHTLFLPVENNLHTSRSEPSISTEISDFTLLIPSILLAVFILTIGIYPQITYKWIDSGINELLNPLKYFIDIILASGGSL